MSIHRNPPTARAARSFAVHASSVALLLFPMLTSCSQSVGPDIEPVATVAEEGLGTCNVNITPLRSIEIVHPNVVSSARSLNASDGTWSFRALIERMAASSGATDTDAFVRSIFETWLTDQTVNGEVLPARSSVQQVILDQFQIAGSSPRRFDLSKAPFQLIAVANRLDLRSSTNAGEGRFVFGLQLPLGGSGKGGFNSMTMIFEYKLPFTAALNTAQAWAAKWHELDAIDPATSPDTFNSKLQEITDVITARGAMPSQPNGSAISQIRSNEIALGSVWELREFNMTSSGLMAPATTKNSPIHGTINNSAALANFLNQTPALNVNDTSFFSVNMPTSFGGAPFLGGKAQETSNDVWISGSETQTNSVRVDNFGLLTCNGCHLNNKTANDIQFYQVSPTASTINTNTGLNDGTGRLSQFMTVGDPSKGARRPAELTRRQLDMANAFCGTTVGVVNGTCTIRTVAGTGAAGSGGDGGLATSAQFTQSFGTGADTSGNFFIADQFNSKVRKVNTSGVISTFAGTGSFGLSGDGGPATSAQLRQAWVVKADALGNVFILDQVGNNVRKVASNGIITTVVGSPTGVAGSTGDGGPATSALLNQPTGLALDTFGNLYIVDSGNAAIRMVNTSGVISTIIGAIGQPGFADATLNTPSRINPSASTLAGIVVDSSTEVNGSSATIYFNDTNNFRVRKAFRGQSGMFFVTSTVAGTGTAGNSGDGGAATSATVTNLQGLALDSRGNVVFSDASAQRIRRVDLASGIISALAGTGAGGFSGDNGPASGAAFNAPEDLATDVNGALLIMDRANIRVRRIDACGT
ncbi:MAG TPA: hypothetical protein VNW92_19120 [Polyangiaceae bacterium]|jgi:hypothetical protein|nr:hypothetical protein [Polyangiaceae bacterium]